MLIGMQSHIPDHSIIALCEYISIRHISDFSGPLLSQNHARHSLGHLAACQQFEGRRQRSDRTESNPLLLQQSHAFAGFLPLIILAIYTIVGALIFREIEGPNEEFTLETMKEEREKLIEV